MEHLLNNPVYHALITGDRHLGQGTNTVRYFHEGVSPFVGFEEGYDNGFTDLYNLLPPGRRILYATRHDLAPPKGWQVQHEIKGLQFVYDKAHTVTTLSTDPIRLEEQHIEEMIQLATLTKPGPFGRRTIDFGHYYGVFENNKLVAMTGQRLHVPPYTEVSAVCTHPRHLGKGYAAALVQHQVALILSQGKIPFLHVRDDNDRAIALYERLGFIKNGGMNFYFMKRA